MNSVMYRLMWKECRMLRGYWLSLAGLGLICDGLIFLLVANPRQRLPGLFGFAGVLPICFALGAGATLFAAEREESTRDFLRYLPLTSWRIFASKVLSGLSGTLLLAALFLSVALGGAAFTLPGDVWNRFFDLGAANDKLIAIWFAVAVQAFGWGVFFSLKSARPLLAAALGAIGATGYMSLASVLTSWGQHNDLWPGGQWSNIAGQFAAATAVWMADIWMGRTWLHGHRNACRWLRQMAESLSPMHRLIWQEWRGSRRILAAMLTLGVLLPMLVWPLFIHTTGLMFALIGACAFLGDQERRQFRFFAERGVAAHAVWLSRQLFWAGAALSLAAAFFLMHRAMIKFAVPLMMERAGPGMSADLRRLWGPVEWVFGFAGYCAWISLAFGAGQLCSMFLRSGILAAASGATLAGLLLGWAALMRFLAIGWWWSVAPLAAALFLATWLRSIGWILERRDWRAWLRPAMVLAVPMLTVLVLVPVYRVWEVPNAEMPLPAETPPPSAEADEAVRVFLQACDQIVWRQGVVVMDAELVGPGHVASAYEKEEQWLRENESKLETAIGALSRVPADAEIDFAGPTVPHLSQLATKMFLSGELAERAGDLGEAWRRYRHVLDLAQHVRRRSSAMGEIMGDYWEKTAEAHLIRWGASEGQTADRLTAALDELRQLEKQDEPLADVVRRDYKANLLSIKELEVSELAASSEQDVIIRAVVRWTPWEFTRARRLLRYIASLNLIEAQDFDDEMAGREPPVASSLRGAAFDRALRLSRTTLMRPLIPASNLIDARRSVLTFRRAAQLALAAEAWRLEHGELPEKLADLEGPYFDKLPVDPYSNHPFVWFRWGLKVDANSRNASPIRAGAPLIYSPDLASEISPSDVRGQLDRLGRRSPDEPFWEDRMQAAAEAAAAAGGPIPAGAKGVVEHLKGLAFPIPDLQNGGD